MRLDGVEPLFCDFDTSKVADGQAALGGWIATLLSVANPDLAQRLERAAVPLVAEPLFFAYFASAVPTVPLEQLAFGYLPQELRRDPTPVRSDHDGFVYLPGIGYLSTPAAMSTLKLARSGSGPGFHLESDGGSRVPWKLIAPTVVGSPPLEIAQRDHSLLASLYRDDSGQIQQVDVASAVTGLRLRQITSALGIIGECCPWLRELMSLAVRRIELFRCPRVNSFAALAAHGLAFLSIHDDDDELFLVEDLAHQCGHVVFSALTFERERWFRADPDLPLRGVNGRADDPRTIYVILHGVFTEALMSLCLDHCFEKRLLPATKDHELLGRLAYVLVRFQRDLADLVGCPLTSEGASLASQLARHLATVSRKHQDRLRTYDVSNQPYTFNYRRFLERNPSPRCSN